MIVVGGVGSQPALSAWLTAVPGFVESPDTHGVGLKQLLDDVPVRVVEVAREVGLGQRRQVAHAVDEKLRVCDAVFLFQFAKKRRCWIRSTMLRKSCVQHNFRIDIDSGVEPCLLLVFELDLLLINGDTIRFDGEVLIVVFGVGLIPVVDSGSGSADAEPLAEVATFRQRRCGGMSSARQPG